MSEIKIIKSETSLEQSLEQYFLPFEEKAKEWMDKAETITVTDASQLDLMEAARESRLALHRIRLDVADTHKELKEESLRRGQLLDKIKRRLTDLITPIEERLESQEKFVERQEAKKKEELYQARLNIALEVMGEQARTIALGDLDEMVFNNMIEGYKLQADKRNKEEEQKRKAAEEEQARLKVENERLRKEQEEYDRLLKIGHSRIDQLTTMFEAKVSIGSISLEFLDRSVKAEFEGVLAMEIAKISSEEFDKIYFKFKSLHEEIVAYKIERDKTIAKEKIKAEEDRQARLKLEREEAERKAKEEEDKKRKVAEERKLKRAPDRIKLEAFVEELKSFKKRVPLMKDDEAQVIASNITDLLTKIEVYAVKQIDKL